MSIARIAMFAEPNIAFVRIKAHSDPAHDVF